MTKRKPKYTPPETFIAQPRIVRVLHMMQRKNGATVEAIATALDWYAPSVRAVISRLAQVGVPLEREWVNGRLVYRVSRRFSGPKDSTRLSKRQAAKLAAAGGLGPRLPK